jgi:hypothetical protein
MKIKVNKKMNKTEVKDMCFKLATNWVMNKEVKCLVSPTRPMLMNEIIKLTNELVETYYKAVE